MLDVITIIAILLVLGLAYRATAPEERKRLAQSVLDFIHRVELAAAELAPERKSFRSALRERTPWALVTPALVAVNLTIFVFMLFGTGTLGDSETLVRWGGNFGPRTTNGEWWRLVTSMFVHTGMLHLLVNVVALAQIGLILERLVGRLAFAAVYVTAGIFASLVSVSSHPVAVSVGASGGIFGLYGLLLASSFWGIFKRSSVTMPLTVAKRLCPAAAVFILYSMANDSVTSTAELTGLVAGLVSGFVLARGVSDHQPPARQVAAAMAVAVVLVVASAIPLRGITDVRPEMERVIAVEDRTAGAYRTAVDRLRKGRVSAEAVAQLIDQTIMPDLQATDARLKSLERVPQEHQPLVADAEEYVRLRSESWRLRAEGLRKAGKLPLRETSRTVQPSTENWRTRAESAYTANMRTLGRAEATERASLEALQKIKLGK